MSGENQLHKPKNRKVLPVPTNEMERLLALNELELDYSDLDHCFADLTRLAAKIAGTSISMISLIDTFTQWSVAPYGIEIRQTPREQSVCQYTILEENSGGMEVNDLSSDERFKDRSYVAEFPYLKYYFGIPLKINDNLQVGSLCVMHDDYKNLSIDQKEMLEIIAIQIVNRIKIKHSLGVLKRQIQEANAAKNNVAHDIRGPLGGIIGLAEIIQIQGDTIPLEELLSYVSLIEKSGRSVLDLTGEILSASQDLQGINIGPEDHEFMLPTLKAKILDMFGPQAMAKQISLIVNISPIYYEIPFPKTNILQILGNLISNSIKFTAAGGRVEVNLDMEILERQKNLKITVKDSGIGMSLEKIEEILKGSASSSDGTFGEKGYGFGLNLVNQLVTKLKGQMLIKSARGEGAEFELILPFS